MSAETVYIDSSIFVKLFLEESGSAALASCLEACPRRVSAMRRTESLRGS